MVLSVPTLIEALDLARVTAAIIRPTSSFGDVDFLAVCAQLSKLSLPVIWLPGKGRLRTGPLTHWPRRAVRNAPKRSGKPRAVVSSFAVAAVPSPQTAAKMKPCYARKARGHRLQPPLMTTALDCAVAQAERLRREKIRAAEAAVESLHAPAKKKVTFELPQRVSIPAIVTHVRPATPANQLRSADDRFYKKNIFAVVWQEIL